MEKVIKVFEDWRRNNNLSQTIAAELIGISQSSYNLFIRQGKAGKIVKRQLLTYLQNHLEEFRGESNENDQS